MSGLIISEVVPGLLDVYFPFLVCRYKRGGLRVLLVGQVPGLTVCGGGVVMARIACACMRGHVAYPAPRGVDDYVHMYIYDPHHFHKAEYTITVRLIQSRYDWNGMVCRSTCLR